QRLRGRFAGGGLEFLARRKRPRAPARGQGGCPAASAASHRAGRPGATRCAPGLRRCRGRARCDRHRGSAPGRGPAELRAGPPPVPGGVGQPGRVYRRPHCLHQRGPEPRDHHLPLRHQLRGPRACRGVARAQLKKERAMTLSSFRHALALAGLVLVACSRSGADQSTSSAEAPALVRAAPVTDTVVARPILATGTVAPEDEIALGFKIGGVIARLPVDVGDRVRAGQALAALDLREIDAGLAKAKSGAAKAERDLARARRLYTDSVVTLAQLQDAETGDEVARADLQATTVNRHYSVIVAPAAGVVLRRM